MEKNDSENANNYKQNAENYIAKIKQDYYYLEALSIEVMNEKGQTRVTN